MRLSGSDHHDFLHFCDATYPIKSFPHKTSFGSVVKRISVSAFNSVRMSLICMITWITYQETPTKTPTIAKNAINFIFAFSEGKNRDYSKPKLILAFRFFFQI